MLLPLLFEITLLALASVALSQSADTTAAPTGSPATSSRVPQTTTIDVGRGEFSFKPDTVQAAVGDIIKFRFFPANHSVVRAEYMQPCIPYELTGRGKTGFASGFEPVDAILDDPPSYSVRVNNTDPIFFYCSAPGSCIKFGMVGVINPNASTSLAKQKDAAMKSTYMLQPNDNFPNEGPPNPSGASSSITSAAPSATSSAPANHTMLMSGSGMPDDGEKHGLSKGTIAGIVVGSIFVAAILAALFFFIGRSKMLAQQVKRDNAARPTSIPASEMYQAGGTGYMPVANPHHSQGYSTAGYKSPDLDEMGSFRSPTPRTDLGGQGTMYANNGLLSPPPHGSPPPQAMRQPPGPHEMYVPVKSVEG